MTKDLTANLASHLPQPTKDAFGAKAKTVLMALHRIGIPLQAVVVGGGWRHGEVVQTNNLLVNDIDFYLFSNFAPLYWRKIRAMARSINTEPGPEVHFQGVLPKLLLRSRTFWAYRLKHEGIVLEGNPNILEQIKADASNLSDAEAIRRLFQALVLQLLSFQVRRPVGQQHEALTPYLIARVYWAIGDAYLILARNLSPSHRDRQQTIETVFRRFGLSQELADRVKNGYAAKIDYQRWQTSALANQLTIDQAKTDCISAIQHQLRYCTKEATTDWQKLWSFYAPGFKPRLFYNLVWYRRLLRRFPARVKLNVIWRFRITDLYQMAIYQQLGQTELWHQLANRYFRNLDPSPETLVSLFEAWPIPATVEIK